MLQQCRTYLSEFEQKRKLFYEDFKSLTTKLSVAFSDDLTGRTIWSQLFDNGQYLRADADPVFGELFRHLEPLERAAWRIMEVAEFALENMGYSMRPNRKNIGANAREDLDTAITKFNDAIFEAHSRHVGVGILKQISINLVEKLDQPERWISELRSRFSEISSAFDLWFPVRDSESVNPFSPSDFTKSRDIRDDVMNNVYICVFDLVRSKPAAGAVKIDVGIILENLEKIGCDAEKTGNDEFLFLANNLKQAISVIQTIRNRTLPYVSPQGYGGLRASIGKGNVVKRTSLTGPPGTYRITDLPGSHCIPRVAYQLLVLKTLLVAGEFRVEDESRGIVIDAELAFELGETTHPVNLKTKSIVELGRWSHKEISGDAYFLLPEGDDRARRV